MRLFNWRLFLEELVGEDAISNIDLYNEGMEKSMEDKLFFVKEQKIDFDVIVDFGCANGKFLENIKRIKPDVKIIGYDLDESMLGKARIVLGDNVLLTSDWKVVVSELSKGYKSPLLNLSSVIHEVYSYSRPNVIKFFWEKQVFSGLFKYITVRDMLPSLEMSKNVYSKFKDDVEKVKKLADPFYLESFEKRWAKMDTNYRTFVHFLLKYRYTDNWTRELNENYLPVSLETIKKRVPSSYSIVYEKDFIVPFIQNQVKEDFDIVITHSTHTKMIIKNKNFI